MERHPIQPLSKTDWLNKVPQVTLAFRIIQEDLLTLVKTWWAYTPPAGQVDLSVAQVQDEILLQVRDSETGIALAERERVFDPFQRRLGSDEVGYGLRLAIVRAITDRHAGRVRLDSADQRAKCGLGVSVAFARVQAAPAGQGAVVGQNRLLNTLDIL